MWVRQWLSEQRREMYGNYSTPLKELRTEDATSFYNYTRLPRVFYDKLLQRVECRIKKDTWYRKSLRPSLKLSITIRHLACGDSYRSLSYNFRVAPNTISLIIHEFCDAIKAEFAAEVIQSSTLQKNGVQLQSNLKRNGNFHTGVVRWMASIWPLHVLGTLAPCTELQRFLLYCPNGLSRCQLHVYVDWCLISWFQQRRLYL